MLALLCGPTLLSCEAIWGGLSRDNHENCVLFPGNCDGRTQYCSPELERCQLLGPPCSSQLASVCAVTGPDRICYPSLGRCATNILLEAINPSAGPESGGVPITLAGQYFRAGMRVHFDGQLANIVEIVSPNKAVVTLPPTTIGPHKASVRVEQADGGFDERTDLFSYGQMPLQFIPQSITVAYYGDEIEVIDTNRDFDPDLIVQQDTRLTTARGDGSGVFLGMVVGPETWTPATSPLAAGDFNQDGYPDLVFGAKHPSLMGEAIIYVATNDGQGNFTLKQSLTIPAPGTVNRIALGDLNGDMKQDILATYTTAANVPKIVAYLNQGTAQFSTTATAITFMNSYNLMTITDLRMADINQDLREDFVISGRFSQGGGATISGFIVALSSTVFGSTIFDKLFDLGNMPTSIALRDLNNDLNLDLIASVDIGSSSAVSVSLGAAGGFFNPAVQYPIGAQIKLARLDLGDA